MKHIYIVIFLLSFAIFYTGCGNNPTASTDSGNIQEIAEKNPQIQEFNHQLQDIKDVETAEQAVNTFISYVDSRLVKKNAQGVALQSLSSVLDSEKVRRIAKQEAAIRNKSFINTLEDGEEIITEPINVGTITDCMNTVWEENGLRATDDIIQIGKDSVESALPSLNPELSPGMSPLNAMAVGYALISGDDGTATAESVNADPAKVGDFFGMLSN